MVKKSVGGEWCRELGSVGEEWCVAEERCRPEFVKSGVEHCWGRVVYKKCGGRVV